MSRCVVCLGVVMVSVGFEVGIVDGCYVVGFLNCYLFNVEWLLCGIC